VIVIVTDDDSDAMKAMTTCNLNQKKNKIFTDTYVLSMTTVWKKYMLILTMLSANIRNCLQNSKNMAFTLKYMKYTQQDLEQSSKYSV
jgi:hypothetical protein